MSYEISGPDAYLLPRMQEKARRQYLDLGIVVVMTANQPEGTMVGFGQKFDWSEVIDWLREQEIVFFTDSPFTNDHRRYFAFVREVDAVAFKLRFS